MNIEERVRILENKVAQLSDAFLNAQRQNVPVVSKVDDTTNELVVTDKNVEVNTANIDYLAMMTDVEIPTTESVVITPLEEE